jgi:UDP-N-acetyl-2-amino-2-deoxyglucuronate dehydrogenase
MSDPQALSFAVIGCGRIAKNHVGPLTELPQAKLVAVCDLVPERAQVYSQKYGMPMYTNYYIMLQQEHEDKVGILALAACIPFTRSI